MLVSKTRVITREKREKNKNTSESTHSVIRPLHCQKVLDKNNTSTGQESLKSLLNVYINFYESNIMCNK